MKITMRLTVEDSHKYVVRDERGVPDIAWDTRKFLKGRTYDNSKLYGEWARQSQYFLDNDWAIEAR